jgi:gamma-butyrobetaine dioxygenase
LNDEDAHYDFLCAIRRLGIALVTDVPKDGATFERLSSKAGLLRDMNWGKIFEIITDPQGEYVANRNHPLDAHSDAATREHMPGLQIFQCVENSSEGGESFWVDGFYLADLLRKNHPEAWELLSTVPWEQANRSGGTHYRWNAPIFDLDRQGNITAVRDTTWLREPLRVDFDLTPRLYTAYRLYSQLKAERANQVERKLVEGDVAFVNNRRVLHGRRGFNSSSGLRHIRTCYGELEELHSSIRMIERARQARQR